MERERERREGKRKNYVAGYIGGPTDLQCKSCGFSLIFASPPGKPSKQKKSYLRRLLLPMGCPESVPQQSGICAYNPRGAV